MFRLKFNNYAKSAIIGLFAAAMLIMAKPAGYVYADDSLPDSPDSSAQTGVVSSDQPADGPVSFIADNSTADQQNSSAAAVESDNQTRDTSTDPSDGEADITNQTGITVDNTLGSSAATGDATLINSGNGGSAATGNALATATLLNLIQSVSGLGAGNLTTVFNYDVYGSQQGDINLDPATLINTQASYGPTLNIDMANNTDAAITNNISLAASSGDAVVENQGDGGAANSGDATTIANVVNIINSSTAAGHTFLGTVNIYGNLQGNILFPAGFLDNLITSAQPTNPADLSVYNNNNIQINNDLSLSSVSGKALVANQSGGGTAASGNSSTSVNILNMVNQAITAKNGLLVFINVLGQWYGLIMNAPPGSSTAELTGGTSPSVNNTGQLEINNQLTINNNLSLSATSGNAEVYNQGYGGTASTGHASSTVNLANVINSSYSMSDWFGMLFINVFGIWNGNFGLAQQMTSTDQPTPDPPQPVSNPSNGHSSGHKFYIFTADYPSGSQPPQTGPTKVAGVYTANKPQLPITIDNGSHLSYLWLASLIIVLFLLALVYQNRRDNT